MEADAKLALQQARDRVHQAVRQVMFEEIEPHCVGPPTTQLAEEFRRDFGAKAVQARGKAGKAAHKASAKAAKAATKASVKAGKTAAKAGVKAGKTATRAGYEAGQVKVKAEQLVSR